MTAPSGDYFGPVVIEGWDQYGRLQTQPHFVRPLTYFWLGAEAEASWRTVGEIVPVHAVGDKRRWAPQMQQTFREWLGDWMR